MKRQLKEKQIKIRVTKRTNMYFEKQLVILGKTKSESIREHIRNTIHNFKNYTSSDGADGVADSYMLEACKNHDNELRYSKKLTETITIKIEEGVLKAFDKTLLGMGYTRSYYLREFIVSIAEMSVSDMIGKKRALKALLRAKPMTIEEVAYPSKFTIRDSIMPLGDENQKDGYGCIEIDFLTYEKSYYWLTKEHYTDRKSYLTSALNYT